MLHVPSVSGFPLLSSEDNKCRLTSVLGGGINESINANCLAKHLAYCKHVINGNYSSYSYCYCPIKLERGGPVLCVKHNRHLVNIC